jgi:four helix bundle protein
MRDFRELDVLHAAHDLVVEIHDISQSFPNPEPFGVGLAIGRTALAIPRSIVNACGRSSDDDLKQGLENAAGYAGELEYLILLGGEIGLLDEETLEEFSVILAEFKKRLADELAQL